MKRAHRKAPWLLLGLLGWALGASAAEVTVQQVDSLGNTLAEAAYASTDEVFTSVSAPTQAGYRFAYWTISPALATFVNRDGWGRALDAVSFIPKDSETTLTAVYLPTSQDEDNDGMADGEELYWYGSLDPLPERDTDGDGYTFAQELQFGLNPLFPDGLTLGGIAWGDSAQLLYNPNEYVPYTLRSEPEGELFETQQCYVSPGTEVTTEAYSPLKTAFAYWTVDGVRQQDGFGRALDATTFTMDSDEREIVAHCVSDESERLMTYWIGRVVAPEEDTDGDGYTFAQELQFGLNPLFKDSLTLGGITWGDSDTFIYNPNSYSPYTIQADPEGTFEMQSGYLRPGEPLATASFAKDAAFAYWDLNGARQADGYGRALDSLTLVGTGAIDDAQVATAHFLPEEADAEARAIAYWYGPRNDLSWASDTDGDGYTLAQELQFGLNPLFPDALTLGGIVWRDSAALETNLQPFDMAAKALIDGELTDLFAVADALNGGFTSGQNFGGAVSPAVFDAEGDGLFDFLVYANGTLTLYRNIGQVGAPDFSVTENAYPVLAERLTAMTRPLLCGGTTEGGPEIRFCDNGGAIFAYTCATAAITELGLTGWPVWSEADGWGTFDGTTLTLGEATYVCDSAPTSVSAAALLEVTGDNTADLLVADTEGRISLYERSATGLALKHRVWGGTYVGFAQGLTLAPVDWEGDGDGDMLAGTAAGHLLLLTDPGVGRPTNLKATAGYDNVLLAWDPNAQSRVCGYNVYRAQAADFAHIAEASLPTYRDYPPAIATWLYRVTTLSRLWKAGNSTPETFESAPSEIVSATLGGICLSVMPEMTTYDNAEIAWAISIDNTQGLSANGFEMTFTYPEGLVEPQGFTCTALTENLTLISEAASGRWRITATGGAFAPGGGPLFSLRFKVPAGTLGTGTLAVTAATFTATDGRPVATNALPISTILTIQARPVPAQVALTMADQEVETLATVEVPVEVTTSGTIDWASLTLTPTFDAAKLTLLSTTPPTQENPQARYTFQVLEQHGDNLFADLTVSGSATSANGLPAIVTSAACRLLITDSNPPQPANIRLTLPQIQETTAGATFTLTIDVAADAPLIWKSLQLTPDFDSAYFALLDSTTPTEASPRATYTFQVNRLTGDDLSTAIRVSGSATSANGLPATVTGSSCQVRITTLKPSSVALSLPASVAVAANTTFTVRADLAPSGEIDWASVSLTPAFDSGKLSFVSATTPSASAPYVDLTFRVAALTGEDHSTTLSVTGTATSANGLPATVSTASSTLTITTLKPATVKLATSASLSAEAGTRISLPVTLTVTSEIDWASVQLTPSYDATKMTFVSATAPTAANPTATLTFDIARLTGADLTSSIALSGSATSANGLPATVTGSSCQVRITTLKPSSVALSLPASVAVTANTTFTVRADLAPSGEIDWASVTLTPAFDSGKLSFVSATTPSASAPYVDLTFRVAALTGEDHSTTLSVTGTATSANGLPATVSTASSTLTITTLKPATVKLATSASLSAEAGTRISLPVTLTVTSEIDWTSVQLTPSYDATKMTFVSATAPTAANPKATLTFDIARLTGADLTSSIALSGSATSANGLPATVTGSSCQVRITTLKPSSVALSLPASVAVAANTTFTVRADLAPSGEIDWASVSLTPAFDSGKLSFVSATTPSASAPYVDLTFRVAALTGEDHSTTLSVTGTATSANGLPATVGEASTRLNISTLKPAKVSLTMQDGTAETEQTVEVAVQVSVVGEIVWSSLTLTPSYDETKLSLTGTTTATAEVPQVIYTFRVLEQHGEELFADLSVTGVATSSNGLAAEVVGTTCRLTITDSHPPVAPTVVPPWTNGDCDGDGQLSWADYDVVQQTVFTYHKPKKPKKHSARPSNPAAVLPEDLKIHDSVCQALGRTSGELSLGDISLFAEYIRALCGERGN